MPLAFALVGSALIHLGILLGPEWELPGLPGADAPAVVEAVLVPPSKVVPVGSAPVPAQAKPKPRKPAPKPRFGPDPIAAEADSAATVAAAAPAAVPPAPTFEPAAPAAVEPAALSTPPAPPPAPARIALPGKGRVHYAVTRGEQGFIVGQSVHEWEHDGSRYRARSVTETTGLASLFKTARVVMSSEGRIVAGGLAPVEFRHEKVKGVDAASFDWERHLLSFEGKEVALLADTQDMLSLYYQAVLVARVDTALDLPVATGRKLERYHFEPKGEERLTLGGKEWRTLRFAAKSGADTIELWIAPDAQGLPLKIRFVDRKGDSFEQIADAIETKETP